MGWSEYFRNCFETDFPAQLSLGFTEDGLKKRKYPVSSSSLGENALLMPEVRGEQPERTMSQSSDHLKLVSWTWQWVHWTQMTSTVTRSQSSRELLWCGGTGYSHNGHAANISAATVWCCHVIMDQNLCKGVQPGTSKVYLRKWLVSVCFR